MKAPNTPLRPLPDLTPAHRDATSGALALYLQHAREYAADPASTGDIEHWAIGRGYLTRPSSIGDLRHRATGRDSAAKLAFADSEPWAPERDYAAELDRWADESGTASGRRTDRDGT